jgi:hypothetical protein
MTDLLALRVIDSRAFPTLDVSDAANRGSEWRVEWKSATFIANFLESGKKIHTVCM